MPLRSLARVVSSRQAAPSDHSGLCSYPALTIADHPPVRRLMNGARSCPNTASGKQRRSVAPAASDLARPPVFPRSCGSAGRMCVAHARAVSAEMGEQAGNGLTAGCRVARAAHRPLQHRDVPTVLNDGRGTAGTGDGRQRVRHRVRQQTVLLAARRSRTGSRTGHARRGRPWRARTAAPVTRFGRAGRPGGSAGQREADGEGGSGCGRQATDSGWARTRPA